MKSSIPQFGLFTFFLLVFTPLAGCGGSGGDGGGGGGGSGSSGGACPAIELNESCVPCLNAHCSSEISAALGAGWSSKEFSGACSAMTSCACACGSGDSGCVEACIASASFECQHAELTVNSCATQSCQTNCVLL